MKFDSNTHIVGKVYDLTQENMNAMLATIEQLQKDRAIAVEALEKIKDGCKRAVKEGVYASEVVRLFEVVNQALKTISSAGAAKDIRGEK